MSIINHQTLVLSPDCEPLRDFMLSVPERFAKGEGIVIHKGRNELRKITYQGNTFVIKAFHTPNIINRWVYGVFRPSKAKRSFVHAQMFLNIGVGTPRPVGYLNIRKGLMFDRSYYVTYESPCPYTYEALFKQKFDYEDEVLRAVGATTALLHEHGYAHKDLPATPHMHRILADEYAKRRGFDAEECYRLMVAYRSTQPGKIDGLY